MMYVDGGSMNHGSYVILIVFLTVLSSEIPKEETASIARWEDAPSAD